ncbi:hypothetical protein [Neobacillus sp. FSL H8-0543]|uniref:hypothetical protein n=1 Tax=Neobacillus sp. FSL H8-0543 TaxID=2954672 RepID=UPI003157F313
MGIRCTCGAMVSGTDPATSFVFIDPPEGANGGTTHSANVCADRLDLSTVGVVFMDTDGVGGDRSFEFNSNEIQSVLCEAMDGVCTITVIGMGMVEGETVLRQFQAVYVDGGDVTTDTALINITGFANSSFAAVSVIALGCGL